VSYPAAVVRAKRKLNPAIDATLTRARRSAGERRFVELVEQARQDGRDLRGLESRLHPAEEATSLIVAARKPG
jgi:hypothetical protein